MRRLVRLLLLISVLLAPARGQGAFGPSFGIDTTRLADAALLRPADLLGLLPGWTPGTVDDFSWQVYPATLPLVQGPDAHLSLDGLPLVHAPFEPLHPNLLPVSADLVETVRVSRNPTDGRPVLSLAARPPPPGWSAAARVMLGNPTGDPGPFRYRTPARNVDKIGPDYELDLARHGRRGWVRLSLPIREDFATDAELIDRVEAASAVYPKQSFVGPAVHARLDAWGGRHTIRIGRSIFRDYFFFRPLLREIPTRRTQTEAGVYSRFETGARTTLETRVHASDLAIRERTNPLDARLRWSARTLDLLARAAHRTDRIHLTAGAALGRTAPTHSGVAALTTTIAFARIEAPSPAPLRPFIEASGGVSGAEAIGRIEAGAVFVPDPRHRLTLTAEAGTVPAPTVAPIAFWRDRGWTAADAVEVQIAGGRPRSARRAGLAVDARRSSPGWTLGLHASAVRTTRLDLTMPVPGIPALDVEPDVLLHRLRAGVRIRARPGPSLRTQAAYALGGVGGDARARRLGRALPRHDAHLQAVAFPDGRLSLLLAARARSATRWAVVGPDADVPGYVTLDLGARKRLWGDRARAELHVRDVPNRRPRLHPLGARLGLRYFLHVQLTLDD